MSSILAIVLAGWVAPPSIAGSGIDATMNFAAKMAREGNWREARFRWERALGEEPDNPRLHNNVAVALEALGLPEEARTSYERALALAGDDDNILTNLRRFQQSWRGTETGSTSPEPTESDQQAPVAKLARGSPQAIKGKPLRVSVSLPVPPRLNIDDTHRLLVASFLSEENELLDVGHELVRFLRSEFRKGTALEVLDITPAPAIPEQTLTDLLANQGFWRHMGREYDADLIVTGLVSYDRLDSSGFQAVDVTSPTTGQKVRQTQFVEQEQFTFQLQIGFIDGASGLLRFQDKLQRKAVFRGQMNDPVAAFYELSETIVGDVLAVVTPRSITESRIVFKN